MRVDQRLRNSEAKSEPSKASGDFSLSLFECVKDFVDLFPLDADAGVDNASLDFVWRRVKRLNGDSTSFGSELHTVLDQIPKDLLQSRRIAFHVSFSGAKMKFHIEIFGSDFFAAYFVRTLQNLVHACRLET